MRLDELSLEIKEKLSGAGISEADSETRIILREIAGISSTDLFSHPEKDISDNILDEIHKVLNRRMFREPLQYILGEWDFMGLRFEVQKGVLIPRPDTEILVECALKELHDGMRFLDLCTGTGCIAISLMAYSNDCTATAVDISDTAVGLAGKNADRILNRFPGAQESDCSEINGAEKRKNLDVVLGDLYDGATGTYDIIVSNPPYINSSVIDTLEKEVKDYEPHLALDGGSDGLDLIRRIINGAPGYLNGGGILMMEIGYDQGPVVMDLMKQAGFKYIECVKDYAGLDRVVIGHWSAL